MCVIAAAVSPDTIFAFLLNSSGAIILFVYLLIAISQIVLRYRTDESKLRVKMWLFPVLSILTAVAILAILVQMGIQKDVRSQLVLSLLSWAVVLVFYFANKQFIARRPAPAGVAATDKPHRVLVLANETANSGELLDELRRIGADTAAKYFVVVPASPIETGVAATHGPLDLAEATQQAAQQRLDYTLTTLRSDNLDADGALGDYRPLRALAKRCRHVPPGSDRDRDVAARIFRVAPFRRGGPRTCRVRRAGHARGGHPGGGGTERAMTILAGVSWSGQSSAPLNLAAQISRNTGDKIIATAIVERPWPPKNDPGEDEYLGYVSRKAQQSLEQLVSMLPADLDISVVVHQSTSIPTGLTDLAAAQQADLVVVGSSSAGLLGRVALGSVTDRLVHTAVVPVALAPRGYPLSVDPVRRLTAAYGGQADVVGLIATCAELAKKWSVRLRIASFTVRPTTMFSGSIEPSAEDLVVEQWSRRTFDEIAKQLNDVRASIAIPDVEVVIGTGHDWREAVETIAWETGDILLLGSGAAGPAAQVFLGSAASKILRHAPVPVMIVPRQPNVGIGMTGSSPSITQHDL